MATKKKATKSAPKKATAPKVVGFNILEQGADLVAAADEMLSRAGSRVTNSTVGDPNKPFLLYPVPDFVMQYALKARGFVSGTTINIIGAEGAGKSTFCYTMMGWGMMFNSPAQHIETEGKPMDPVRIKQALHPDPVIAEALFKAIRMDRAREISEAVDKIESWARFIRDPKSGKAYVPIHIPIASYLDTYSKLMSPSEAKGYAPYETPEQSAAKAEAKEKEKGKGKGGKKSKTVVAKELGGGSNMGHAKMAHAWGRRLPALLNAYNMVLFIVSHQNDKVDMSGQVGGGSIIPADVAEGFNKTTIGGRAFAQSAAYQWIVTPKEYEVQKTTHGSDKVARTLKMNIIKNNYGPPRDVDYQLVLKARRSTDTYQEPLIHFNKSLPYVLARTGLVSVTHRNQNAHTCKELGVDDADVHTFAAAFYRRPDLIHSLGVKLGFMGYGDGKMIPNFNPYVVPHEHDVAPIKTEGESDEPVSEPTEQVEQPPVPSDS